MVLGPDRPTRLWQTHVADRRFAAVVVVAPVAVTRQPRQSWLAVKVVVQAATRLGAAVLSGRTVLPQPQAETAAQQTRLSVARAVAVVVRPSRLRPTAAMVGTVGQAAAAAAAVAWA